MEIGISKSSAITFIDSPASRRARIVAQVAAILSVRSPPWRLRCAVKMAVNSSMRSAKRFVITWVEVVGCGSTQSKQVCPSPKVVLCPVPQ